MSRFPVISGIIPPADADKLKSFDVAAVYTPKNLRLNSIMSDIIALASKTA